MTYLFRIRKILEIFEGLNLYTEGKGDSRKEQKTYLTCVCEVMVKKRLKVIVRGQMLLKASKER